MNRPHPALIVLLALIITLVTYMAPPLFPEGADVERGFPFPWASQTSLPGSSLPLIGPFIQLAETTSLSFSWQFFLLDMGVFCALLFVVFYSVARVRDATS